MLTIADIGCERLRAVLSDFGLSVELHGVEAAIPGTFWGEPEAGLTVGTLHVRPDTPLHSALHEASHFICMTPARRAGLHQDAGGDDDEESAVCYLQILLAMARFETTLEQISADMDAWGYSFRLGSTKAWFECDAEDALAWLHRAGVVGASGDLTGVLRGAGTATVQRSA